jgi:hypothetical protein
VRQDTIVETGRYDLMVGASSEDIRLATVVRATSSSIGTPALTTRRNAREYHTEGRGVSRTRSARGTTATTTASWADIHHPVIDVRLDDRTDRYWAGLPSPPTGGCLQDFTTGRAALHSLSRTPCAHNLYLVFRAGGIYLDGIQPLHRRPR